MPSRRYVLLAVCSTAVLALACTEGLKTPAEPTPGTTTSTLKVTAPTPKDPVNDARLASLPPTLNASEATFTSGTPSPLQYRFEVLKADGTTRVEESSLKTATTWVPAEPLLDNTKYTWRVRAENAAGLFGPWSALASFLTPLSSALVNDPLTNGVTVATQQRGGEFVPGQGWRSLSRTDALDYLVTSCTSCTLEFDATNFGKKEGEAYGADLKWVSMGDGVTFSPGGRDDIGYDFRDHDWKMHLEQRSDNSGTGMKIVWRNGAGGGGNPGDHSFRIDDGPNWNSGEVFHFKIQWSPEGYLIQVNGETIFQESFGGRQYEPPHHLIQLGCTPRGESFVGIIYRNVKITKQ